eukprot:Skav223511  [mRNA]  locus=scaffold1160:220404:226518:+ [translate_table: standard]
MLHGLPHRTTVHALHRTRLMAGKGPSLIGTQAFVCSSGVDEGDETPHAPVDLPIIPDVNILDRTKFCELVPQDILASPQGDLPHPELVPSFIGVGGCLDLQTCQKLPEAPCCGWS